MPCKIQAILELDLLLIYSQILFPFSSQVSRTELFGNNLFYMKLEMVQLSYLGWLHHNEN